MRLSCCSQAGGDGDPRWSALKAEARRTAADAVFAFELIQIDGFTAQSHFGSAQSSGRDVDAEQSPRAPGRALWSSKAWRMNEEGIVNFAKARLTYTCTLIPILEGCTLNSSGEVSQPIGARQLGSRAASATSPLRQQFATDKGTQASYWPARIEGRRSNSESGLEAE